MGGFRDLTVWQKAHSNLLAIIKVVDSFPKTVSGRMVGSQIVRAAGSITANIAEGHGRQTVRARKADFVHFLEMALGSANEVENWLIVARDVGLVERGKAEILIQVNTEVIKMLFVFIKHHSALI